MIPPNINGQRAMTISFFIMIVKVAKIPSFQSICLYLPWDTMTVGQHNVGRRVERDLVQRGEGTHDFGIDIQHAVLARQLDAALPVVILQMCTLSE